MKKILLMLVSLLCATTQVWAAKVTDLSQLSNDKIYFLKSARAFLLYSEANPGMLSSSTGKTVGNVKEDITDPMQHFKILKDGESFYLFSVGAQKFVSDNGSLEDEPNTVLRITAVDNADYPWQLYLGANGMNSQSPNQTDTGILVNSWTYTDPGNCYYIEEARLAFDVEAAKKDAVAKLEELKKGAEAFELFGEDMKTIASAIYRIKHVTPYSDATEDLKNAIDRINDIVGETFDIVYDKTVRFTSYGRKPEGQDLTINQDGANTAINSGDAGLWIMKGKGDGTFTLYNFASDLYLGPTVGTSARIPAKTSENEAGAYALRLHDIANQVINLTNNGNTLHVEGSVNGNVVQWNDNNAGASQWKIEKSEPIVISRQEYDAALEAAARLNQYIPGIQKEFGLVQDAANYYSNYKSDAEGSYEALLDDNVTTYFHSAYGSESGDGSGIHYIQAAFTEGVDEFFLYMVPRSQNGNNRPANITISGSNDNVTYTEIQKITTTLNSTMTPYLSAKLGTAGTKYNYIRLTVNSTSTGTVFFTLSELYFLPATGETGELLNAYSDFSTASITTEGIKEAATTLIAAEAALAYKEEQKEIAKLKVVLADLVAANANNHAVEPAVGQYTTEGYEALKAANENEAITLVELEEALDAFNKAKNLPVFTIDGKIWYAEGKSIYVDASGNLHFKKTDKYDRSMLWVLDQNATTVSPIEQVGIRNFATGEGFWGSETIKITETNPEVADDDIFLFYTTGNGTPIHAQNDLQKVVRWGSYDAGSGSAWTFTYVGSTFKLSQYTETYLQALNELKEMYNNIPDYEFGVGVNYYSEQKHGSLAAAKQQAYEVLAKEKATEEELLAAGKALRIALAQVSLNKPIEGKFYRLRCVDSDKYMQYTITDKKFHMVAGDDGKTHDATFCYFNSGLVSLQNALYMNLSRNEASYSRSLCKVYFTESSVLGQYNIELSERMLYGAGDNLDSGTAVDNRAGYRWQLEEVTEIPVTISEAGYASFYATAAMELPAELEAYYVSYVGEDQVALEQIEGIIPDGAAVLLKGEAGDYNLTVVNEKTTEIKDNKLKGVVVSKYIAGDAYVLAADDAALIKAELNRNGNGEAVENGTHFLANGFSAYLPVADAIQDALTFNFDGSITGVTLVPVTNNANAAIYDLSGRRVVNAVKGGIYIQNGKKFIVK